jgi:cell division protein FtsW
MLMKDKISIYNLYYSWWKNIDKTIFFIIILFFTIGLFFSLVSTSLIASDKLETNSYSFFFKHLIYIFLGIIIIILLSIIDSISLLKFSLIFFFIILISLFLVPLIGVEVKGSKRWIDLFILPRFQPIELLKPFFIIFLATILSIEKRININLKYIFSFMITLLISGFLFIQPDIGQTLLILFTWTVLIFTSGVNILFLSVFASSALIFLVYLVMFVSKFSYIKSRILSFFDKESGTHNFQSDKALDSITSGGFFGKGIGEGTLKNKVPEAHTDYIISVISEEFGVTAIMLIIILFLTFIYTVFKRILKIQEERYKLILVGCSSLILMQAIIHIGVNIRLFPTTGMTLPFLSYGGSSIVSISIISGIILNLTKRKFN